MCIFFSRRLLESRLSERITRLDRFQRNNTRSASLGHAKHDLFSGLISSRRQESWPVSITRTWSAWWAYAFPTATHSTWSASTATRGTSASSSRTTSLKHRYQSLQGFPHWGAHSEIVCAVPTVLVSMSYYPIVTVCATECYRTGNQEHLLAS